MKDTDLIAALRQMKVNTKSLACLGCGYEDRCSTKGCRLIGLAADRLAAYAQAVETIQAMHTAASGVGKSLLRDVLSLFDGGDCQTPEPPRMVCDFDIARNTQELITSIRRINDAGYDVFAVTYGDFKYTVFFHRPAKE